MGHPNKNNHIKKQDHEKTQLTRVSPCKDPSTVCHAEPHRIAKFILHTAMGNLPDTIRLVHSSALLQLGQGGYHRRGRFSPANRRLVQRTRYHDLLDKRRLLEI